MKTSPTYPATHRLFFIEKTRSKVFELRSNAYWDSQLGESGVKVLLQFIHDGMIELIGVEQAIDKHYTKEQLRELLQQRSLALNGTKPVMIARMMKADPEWVQEQSAKLKYYRFTEAGYQAAEKFCCEKDKEFYDGIISQHKAAYKRDLIEWRKTDYVVGLKIYPHKTCNCLCDIAGNYQLKNAPRYPFNGCTEEICCCLWECIFEDKAVGIEWKIPEKKHAQAGGKIDVPEEPETEESIRKLAKIVTSATGTKFHEGDIQTMLVSSGLRKPKGIFERLLGLFSKKY